MSGANPPGDRPDGSWNDGSADPPNDGLDGGSREPERHELSTALTEELAHDERVRWAVSADRELIRSTVVRTVGLGGGALVAGMVLITWFTSGSAAFFDPSLLLLPVVLGAVVLPAIGAGSVYALSRYEAAATDRRLLLLWDVPVVGGRKSVEWAEIEELGVTPTLTPWPEAGNIVVTWGGTLSQLSGSGRAVVRFVPDPMENLERLQALRGE